MNRGVVAVVIAIFCGLAGCESRECDLVQTSKGDQICSEDVEDEVDSEYQEANESDSHPNRD
ncbi:MAG: hypothetical protein P9E24_00530 [Candidatus Competibacter sp.]|nr:hypothetical protein [Candidatus Competibacter sp.]MDG4583916.1 hypothetical protein [Candidatus Competibacter sp.]